tara:strand:+ start:51 stop:977 length:927 start_codon:yes stop_codon:yes gene_type:complete
MFKVAALYKFQKFDNFVEYQKNIQDYLKINNILGTILIGAEGINGTIAGMDNDIDAAVLFLQKINDFKNLNIKYSFSKKNPFLRLKVKLKKEIVTIGDDSIDPNINSGEYVEPKDWNNLISDKNVLLIDARNNYEVSIGSFKNSINPRTKNFRDFPKWVNNLNISDANKKSLKVAMYCTGGIRCEKASCYMKALGFHNVFHLKGGVLKYFEEVKESESLWNGECFVFDERVALKHDLSEGNYDMCHGCRMPITESDKKLKEFKKGVSCHQCFYEKTEIQKSRYENRQKQIDLAKSRNKKHIGQSSKYG